MNPATRRFEYSSRLYEVNSYIARSCVIMRCNKLTTLNPSEMVRHLKVGERDIAYYSIPSLEESGIGHVSSLPISLRIILESLLRNLDGKSVTAEDVVALANWDPKADSDREIPFKVGRVLMQDFTGVPSIVDLAAMRDVLAERGIDPSIINPKVPVDLVTDHSVQVDYYGSADALKLNMDLEFKRNQERYRFLKWAAQSFNNFRLFPPGLGICHQINLEFLSRVVSLEETKSESLAYFDSLVGTDSHTTMVNGIGVVGWGVGGIEAEAAMLGQPVSFKTPSVVGFELRGRLREGVTATDLVLTVTEILRSAGVVNKFVEFYGDGVKSLSVPDRATVSNMCPEYGATLALFPVDDQTVRYLRLTGRSEEQVALVENYYKAQKVFGEQGVGRVFYSQTLQLDLDDVNPSISGPALPWKRLSFSDAPSTIKKLVQERSAKNGSADVDLRSVDVSLDHTVTKLSDGDVVIAAITSCTNTSNPSTMIGAGLLAKKAVEKGLKVPPHVKTSLAPGSRVVTEYLAKSGLLSYLERLGFSVVGYGCTTCIGNSGPLNPAIENSIRENQLVVASVLSGNRNFESRIHKDVRANYLMSPPLVVAYAIAGSLNKDISKSPLSVGTTEPVYLEDLWPTNEEITEMIEKFVDPQMYKEKYSNFDKLVPEWSQLESPSGKLYIWDDKNTYIQKPPFFKDFKADTVNSIKDIVGCRPLMILGDSVTTDHISPAGSIAKDSPAAKYLLELGVDFGDFNSYGARRGNHNVMMRGTFSNRLVRNLMVPGKEGGFTIHYPSKQTMSVFDAAMKYASEDVPLVIIAGSEYGAGSSRDWAAKGPKLLGVKAVIAKSFERIHRTNLIGMGILPLQFPAGIDASSLGLTGSEKYSVLGLRDDLSPNQKLVLRIERETGELADIDVICRLDTEIEVAYYKNGGILEYVLRKFIAPQKNT